MYAHSYVLKISHVGVKNKNTEPVEDESGPPEAFPSLGDALRMAHGRPNTKAKEKASTDSQGTPKAGDGDGECHSSIVFL